MVSRHAILRDVDYISESRDPARSEVYFPSLKGKMQVAYPVFIDGTPIDPSGDLHTVNRRVELGRLIIQSDYLSRALVNRLWAHFLSYSFSSKVDDLGPHVAFPSGTSGRPRPRVRSTWLRPKEVDSLDGPQ